MVGIDLFAGAGGMSIGACAAGIDVRFAVESDPIAAATYRRNHPDTPIFCGDIRSLSARRLRSLRPARLPLVVFGGPPCQGFSYSNQKTRRLGNPQNWLFKEFIRVVRLCQPEWIVFENVKGITDTEGGIFLSQVLEGLQNLSYRLTHGILNAISFGVPQWRDRLFVIGTRGHDRIPLPKPQRRPPVTVRHALDDLPRLENGARHARLPYRYESDNPYVTTLRGRLRESTNHHVTRNADYVIHRYRHVPPGGNWEDIPARLMRNYADRTRCHTGIYHRLEWDKPSIVIGNFRKNMLIHPKQNRGLSVREAARLQSFPDSYVFEGSIGFQQQQVGNAVPPLLATAVFNSIMRIQGPQW